MCFPSCGLEINLRRIKQNKNIRLLTLAEVTDVSGEAGNYGALAFSEPEKSQAMIKDIIESAYDYGAEMIVTPCPVCQMNTEVYQEQINAKYKTKFKMPVVYYSTLMSVAYGKSYKESALDGQIIKATALEKIAGK